MVIVYMLIAGAGGFVGTIGRYLTGIAGKKLFGSKYPAGTFAVNVVGCFIIGLLVGLLGHHEMDVFLGFELTPDRVKVLNALLVSGFCGGFTTFSSFSHDSYAMIKKGEWGKFAAYIIPTVLLGLFFVWLGIRIAA